MTYQLCKKIRTSFELTSNIIQTSCLFILLLFIVSRIDAQKQENNTVSAPPPVIIAGTQLLHLSSAITNEDYDLYINLPRGYSDTSKTFPVLFLIDAQWDFSLVQAIYCQQYYDGFIPEMIIVGITWGGKSPDYDKLRAHDLTPSDISQNGTYGNAQKFHSFITKELIQYIEKKFRVKHNDRTLMGSSYGGLFTLYAMFQAPEAFNHYILTSPAIQWDNKLIYRMNKSFAEQHKELAANAFIGIGEYEDVKGLQSFIDEVKSTNYKDFELQFKIIEGMGHSGGKAEGYSRGLQAVFSQPNIQLDAAVLDTYTGKYSINSFYGVTLVQEQGNLVFVAPDNSRITFKSASKDDFYVPGQFLKVHIEKNEAGEITGFTLSQYSGSMLFKKRVK